MSPQFEQVVIFSVISVLVTLFSWIYVRDRQQRVGLWMLGWIAIFIHFSPLVFNNVSLLSANWKNFIKVSTLEIAGVSFVLSVSLVYATTLRRFLYVGMIGIPSVIYLALVIWAPQQKWIFPWLILLSTAAVLGHSARYYRPKSFYFYVLLGLPGGYAAWAAVNATRNPGIGLIYYLSTLFIVTGFLYIRFYRRFTPGVITTSVSFLLWGLVFPVSAVLRAYNLGPKGPSYLWDLPKYMVAFGMILTLFENETAAATSAARQYRALFEVNLAAVYLSTMEGRVLDCNAAFVNMYGYGSKEEVLTTPAISLYLDSEDRERFLDELRQHGNVINYECRQRRKDGSLFWILERATILKDASGKTLIEGTAIDITERKQAEMALRESEERFATIFRHSPVGCGIVTLDGIFVNANEALANQLGRHLDEMIGKSTVEVGLWRSPETRQQYYQRLRAEGSIKNMEIEFTHSNGETHIGLFFGTLVRIGDKECIFGMQLDRTEQRELEAKFLQAQKMEAVGRLAGGVAHDFNNLLGVIGGYAELLEARLTRDEKLRQYCTKILETTQRAGNLTTQLLTFSRKEISRPAPLDANHAIRELATILPRLIGEDIELKLDLRAKSAVVIDKVHFDQIIFNVVVNARDAMPGGGELTIITEETQAAASGNGNEKHNVVIRIRDTGIGMNETIRLRAFEPFFTTKDTGQGTGLGLSTVYGIVQQCGGEVSIETQLGKGTEIVMSLPATSEQALVPEERAAFQPARGHGHILLVEDEIELRNTNAEFLESIGYSISCAGNGPEALQMINQIKHVDLVISDVVMPKMSGREFADRLLEIHPDIKLLFVSGYADDVVLQAGISRLGTPFLQKPYTLRQLAGKIQDVLAAPVQDATVANGD